MSIYYSPNPLFVLKAALPLALNGDSRRPRSALSKVEDSSRRRREEDCVPKMEVSGWQTVPGSGSVPLIKYALIAVAVQRPNPESEVC